MSEWPKISVVVGTRNRATYLKRMLDKLLEDDYPNTEIIIVDGASTDGTVALLQSYGPRITRWVSEPDAGEYFAYDKALCMATGEIIKFMSDDDVLRPGALRLAREYFVRHPDVDIVFGRTAFWDEVNGSPTFIGETNELGPQVLTLRHVLRETGEVATPASFFRRSVMERIGPLSTEYSIGDMEFWARAASRGLKMGLMPEVILDYYITGDNGVIRKKWEIAFDMLVINMRYGGPSDVTHCVWRKYALGSLGGLCHRLGIHPLRAWRRWRSRISR